MPQPENSICQPRFELLTSFACISKQSVVELFLESNTNLPKLLHRRAGVRSRLALQNLEKILPKFWRVWHQRALPVTLWELMPLRSALVENDYKCERKKKRGSEMALQSRQCRERPRHERDHDVNAISCYSFWMFCFAEWGCLLEVKILDRVEQ